MSSLQAVTNEDFEQSVIKADTPVLVDFYAVVLAKHRRLFLSN